MIQVFHGISDLSKSSGGPTNFLSELTNKLNSDQISKNLLFAFNSDDNNDSFLIPPIYYKSFIKNLYFNWSYLKNYPVTSNTVIHHHGLWQFPLFSSFNFSKKYNLPFIVSPHGMLEPWSLRQNLILKKIAGYVYQNYILNNADYLHATSLNEARNIRNLGFTNKIYIIPNGIDTNRYTSLKSYDRNSSQKKILFLSRIHKKKGIEILIEAFSLLDPKLRINYAIDIVGDGDKTYIGFLKGLIDKFSLQNFISISCPVYGSDKIKLLQDAYITVLPSYSENFGNVILESISCGTPVITTKETPWEILNSTNSGWCIDQGVESLFKCLDYVLRLDQIDLRIISNNARKLATTSYDITTTAKMHNEMYRKALNYSYDKSLIFEYE